MLLTTIVIVFIFLITFIAVKSGKVLERYSELLTSDILMQSKGVEYIQSYFLPLSEAYSNLSSEDLSEEQKTKIFVYEIEYTIFLESLRAVGKAAKNSLIPMIFSFDMERTIKRRMEAAVKLNSRFNQEYFNKLSEFTESLNNTQKKISSTL